MRMSKDIKEIKEESRMTAESVDLLIKIQSKNLKRD